MMSRLIVRPIMSRRLRAALVFLGLMSLLALSETSLTGWGLGLASTIVVLGVIHIWLRLPGVVVPMVLSCKPPQLQLMGTDDQVRLCQCVSLNVYTWLVILRYRDSQASHPSGTGVILLLPDSLPADQRHNWRRVMVWAKLMRRAIGARKEVV